MRNAEHRPGAKDAMRFRQKKPEPPPGMESAAGFLDGKQDPRGGKLPPERAEEVRKKKQDNSSNDTEMPAIPEMMREKLPTKLVEAWEGGQPL